MAELDDIAIAKAREELARLRSETLKLDAERRSLEKAYEESRNTLWDRFGELIKTAGAVVALVVAGITAVATPQIIKLQTELARRDKEVAERQRDVAVSDAERVSRDLGTLLAQKNEVVRQRDTAKKELDELRKAISGLHASDPASVARVRTTSQQVQVPTPARPFVYIVSSSPTYNGKADDASRLFANQNYQTYVRRAQQLQGQAPDKTEVRYFRASDADEAHRIADALKNLGLETRVALVSDRDIKQARYFEVRFARDPICPFYPFC
jgi:hypothetical protein